MKKKNVHVNVGGGFTGMLILIFITLKLIGIINWSWVWVLAPLWISAALVVGLVIFVLVLTFIKSIIDKHF